jgi:hypothetical protein
LFEALDDEALRKRLIGGWSYERTHWGEGEDKRERKGLKLKKERIQEPVLVELK